MALTQEQEARLVRMQTALRMCELYAEKWMTMINCGANQRRIVRTGADNHLFTSDELIDDALACVNRHIERMEQISNNIALLMEGREDEIDSPTY